jgi:hypothetical protein
MKFRGSKIEVKVLGEWISGFRGKKPENPILRPRARLSRLRPRAERYGLWPISAGSFGFRFLFRYSERFSFFLGSLV